MSNFPPRPLPRKVYTPAQAAYYAQPFWLRQIKKRSSIFAVVSASTVLADHFLLEDSLTRTARTLWTGLVVTLDFKINFQPGSESLNDLHVRAAKRITNLIETNGGLYIKLGQQIATQSQVLPTPYRTAFSSFVDDAPAVPWPKILPLLVKEFGGRHPDEIFESFEQTPFASASIAQVYRATTKDGRKVAVKVQKPAIPIQLEWDLWSYRTMMYLMQKVFDLPTYFVAAYVSDQMRKETSFLNEADNARKTIRYLETTPSLRGKIHVPAVYSDLSTDKVLTMEYVDACKIDDKAKLQSWNLSLKTTMDTVLNCFACQIFDWGWVHCDPHPGNILVRPHPSNPRRPQIVLVDHGLYISLSEKFKREYSTLWRSIFVLDVPAIEETALAWGITFDSDMFASSVLLRPTRLHSSKRAPKSAAILHRESLTEYELQLEIRDRMRAMLENERLIPRELIFLVRSQRMLQGANQSLGSPSNRVNITARWAAHGFALTSPLSTLSLFEVGLRPWLRGKRDLWLFGFALSVIDVGFWISKIQQWVGYALTGKETGGVEEQLQRSFEKMAEEEFGIDLKEAKAFEG
ncbi:ABC1 family-domain-containing protein [Mrakia frigida]|uniref:ABC1 kinase family protein n=1 Tax=Mrakia frigida TaxID=29902 RepID=UPI003FCC147B